MVNEKNDTAIVQEQASGEADDNTSAPQAAREEKPAGTRGRSKPRPSRKKNVSPESMSSEQAETRQEAFAAPGDESPAALNDASQAGAAATETSAAPQSGEPEEREEKDEGAKRPRKTSSRGARATRTSASSKGRKKSAATERTAKRSETPDDADATESGVAKESAESPEISALEASSRPVVNPDGVSAPSTESRTADEPAMTAPEDAPAFERAAASENGDAADAPEELRSSPAEPVSPENKAAEHAPDSKDASKPEDNADMPSAEREEPARETASAEAALGMTDAVALEPRDDMPEESPFGDDISGESDSADENDMPESGHEADEPQAREEDESDGEPARGDHASSKAGGRNIPDSGDAPDNGKSAATDAEESGHKLQKKSKRKMFISVQTGEQAEVVLTEDGVVEEYYVEMQHQAKTKGNIYKGTIHNIDANLQAAFVSYGAEKNGFLQIDEVHPEYYLVPHEPAKGKKYPLMQKVLRPGQEVLVQVVKEPTGNKGAFLTTYLSLPGRFLVLTPGSEQIGVSRKVDNAEERERLRSLLEGLDPGPGLGVIVRTVSFGASKAALQRDFQYLTLLWKDIRAKGTVTPPPCLLHREPDLAARAVRDYLTEDVNEIWVDDEDTAASIREVIGRLFPRRPGLVKTHRDQMQTLWERFSLLKQLEQIYAREVFLPSGGRLVFDQTEALTAIDINSGKTSGKNNFEAMALRTNQEAAEAIARQLRLRDLGGQVVIDFIEMRDRNHWREVEKTMRNAMKVDRARYDVGKISGFGLMELVRQRLGSSALSITMESCPLCRGTGLRRNMEWQSQQALREIKRRLRSNQPSPLVCEFDMELALYLLNNKRGRILELEREFDQRVEIHPRH